MIAVYLSNMPEIVWSDKILISGQDRFVCVIAVLASQAEGFPYSPNVTDESLPVLK